MVSGFDARFQSRSRQELLPFIRSFTVGLLPVNLLLSLYCSFTVLCHPAGFSCQAEIQRRNRLSDKWTVFLRQFSLLQPCVQYHLPSFMRGPPHRSGDVAVTQHQAGRGSRESVWLGWVREQGFSPGEPRPVRSLCLLRSLRGCFPKSRKSLMHKGSRAPTNYCLARFRRIICPISAYPVPVSRLSG